jgi:hypothetical protein
VAGSRVTSAVRTAALSGQAHDHCQAEAANLKSSPMSFKNLPLVSVVRAITLLALVMASNTAGAQMPGLPVLQNAFVNRGLTLGADGGAGSEGWGAGAAVSLGTSSGRIALSGGLGAFTPERAGARTSWGIRVSGSIFTFASGTFGLGAFVGYGGAGGGNIDPGPTPGDTTTSDAVTRVPLGAAIGYQHRFGGLAMSLYTSPAYVWYNKGGSGSTSSGVFRVPVGLDIGLTRSIGLSVGAEFGGDAASGSLGPRGATYGAALSYVLKR